MNRPALSLLLILPFCLGFLYFSKPGDVVVRRPGEPDIYRVPKADLAMNSAMAQARASLDPFLAEVQSPHPGASYSLKARFDDGRNVEHIWLINLRTAGGQISGEINNAPERIKTVSLGQRVVVPRARVSDWLIVANGRYRGGFTVRVLRSRMPRAEQRQLDQEMGLTPE
jgi:uncharacterized protein YegJ (DUF2314 family)